jgi:hypothetical protein
MRKRDRKFEVKNPEKQSENSVGKKNCTILEDEKNVVNFSIHADAAENE